MKMRAVWITLTSLALTTAVIGNAYYQKKQFYPSVVYITKSNPSMAVMYVQAFILVILLGKLMRKVFFGQLRASEFEHLLERSWYAVTETCIAFTVFRDDFSPKFVALFTLLLFLKSFHWLAEDRVDFMERSPVISWLFHIRVLSLLLMLGSLDLHFVGHAYQSTVTKGASVQLVFGFEYAILLTIIINICIKYMLHTIDLNSENPWDNKAVFLLYTELVMGFFKVLLYICFVAIMVRIYTLPLFAFRPMYYTMRSFKKAFNDVILSRRAINNMNTLYPDATPEELAAADNVCIICREEMVAGQASKKLPCNHIFHTSCLRSWFQRQQTCPTCRLNILRSPTPPSTPAPPPPQQPAQPPVGGQQIPGGFQGFQGPLPFWQMIQQPPILPQQRPSDGSSTGSQQASDSTGSSGSTTSPQGSTQSTSATTSSATGLPFMCPLFPFMNPLPPPPMPPANLSTLTVEELRRMEGNARENVEARLQWLRNIQLLLDTSVTMMGQYSAAVAASNRHNVSQTSGEASASGRDTTASQDQSPSTSSQTPAPNLEQNSSKEAVHATSTNNEAASKVVNSTSESLANTESLKEESQGPSNLSPRQGTANEEIRRRRLQKFAQSLPAE